MTPLAEAVAAYLQAREDLRAAPDGSPEEGYALNHAVSMLEQVRAALKREIAQEAR